MNFFKLIIALLIAAIMPAILFLPALFFPGGWFYTLIALTFSLIHALLFGLPIIVLLRFFGLIRWWSLLIASFLIGALPMTILSWLNPRSPLTDWAYLSNFIICGLLGMSAGGVFWLLWRYWIKPPVKK